MKIMYPYVFILLVIPVVLAVISYRRNRKKGFDFSGAKFLFEVEKHSVNFKLLSSVFKYVALVLLIVALARPVTTKYIESDIQKSALDIMFCVDISTSMNEYSSTSSKPRIEIAGDILMELSGITQKERTGLVVFAFSAYTVMPLSFDHNSIDYYASNLHKYPGTIEDGTAVWDAIIVAKNRLYDDSNVSQAIIVITDGYNNSGISVPEEVEAILTKNNIRLYCINVGDDGYVEGNLENSCYNTGGKYFELSSDYSSEMVWKEIKKLERNKVSKTEYFEYYIDHYSDFLLVAAILLALAMNIEYIACKGVVL